MILVYVEDPGIFSDIQRNSHHIEISSKIPADFSTARISSPLWCCLDQLLGPLKRKGMLALINRHLGGCSNNFVDIFRNEK